MFFQLIYNGMKKTRWLENGLLTYLSLEESSHTHQHLGDSAFWCSRGSYILLSGEKLQPDVPLNSESQEYTVVRELPVASNPSMRALPKTQHWEEVKDRGLLTLFILNTQTPVSEREGIFCKSSLLFGGQ